MPSPYGLEIIESCLTCHLRAGRLFCDLPQATLEAFEAVKQTSTYPKGALMYGQSRHLFVDNSTTPVTIWIGQDHMAAITRIEPLD